MLLAFFIPSIQDQWDRYESRNIIQQYVELGDDFMKEENYQMAVASFTKAFELSEEKRLDIEIKRLDAKVNLIYQNPVWSSEPPEGLEEVDFQFLLHLKKGPEHVGERASILTGYGIYLAAVGKPKEAEQAIRKAISLNPIEALAYINLGNLLDEAGKINESEKAYRRAIQLAPGNARVHYNLGLLHLEKNDLKEAEKEFNKAVALDPHDTDAVMQRDVLLKKLKN
jgi:tetratricopeptide (TPR) repeat protein